MYHFVRIGAAVPKLSVADCTYNKNEIIQLIQQAADNQVQVLAFPELCITAYTCGDLFMQSTLLESAKNALCDIITFSKDFDLFLTAGLPIAIGNQCFNCSASIHKGKLLGLVPKTSLPNYGEFYEKRWFSSADDLTVSEIEFCGQKVPIGSNLLFQAEFIPYLTIGVEICEDLWSPIPPSSHLSLQGATVLLNLSASNEVATKYEYRNSLITQQSARCIAAYVYASAGIGESTQDMVFSGHSLLCENGTILKESSRFSQENQLIYYDTDLEMLVKDRRRNPGYMTTQKETSPYRILSFSMKPILQNSLERKINPLPFIPGTNTNLENRCNDIFQIQVTGLAQRMRHAHADSLIIGISGGLDSTLALLVCIKACDFLGLDRKKVIGITMPGFGTTDRTYQNALNLMKALGTTVREISIRDAALQHFQAIGHDPEVHDVTYENTQARERTQILMDVANQQNGLVVGTGDLSELALGWATYNGDHMSMYGVNAGIPKTLVRVLVDWVAKSGTLKEESSHILMDVLDTPVSPELLPPSQGGKISQKTEEIVGPYELHDFFLYYVIRFGFSPKKIFYLAQQAFSDAYEKEVLLKWLKNFYRRFFTQQFKRSCLPDGPKVGTISLSPRGDWRMPSDASSRIWLDEVEKIIL